MSDQTVSSAPRPTSRISSTRLLATAAHSSRFAAPASWCVRSLDPAADDHNAIILISDGGDLRGEALKNAEAARKRGIPIFTVGIGDPKRGATIPAEDGRGVQKFDGKPVTVKLEETALKAIAEASKGAYVPLATAGTAETTLGAIYRRRLRQIALMEQNEEESRLGERYQIFLVPGLVLLLVGAALSKGRFAKRKVA